MPNSTCRWPDCDTVKIKGHGFCNKHYLRAWKLSDFESPWLRDRPACRWPDCSTIPVSREYCNVHHERAARFPDSSEPWIPWAASPRSGMVAWSVKCIWPACGLKTEWRDFCTKHYYRAWSVGNFTAPWEALFSTCAVCGVEYCPLQVRGKGRTYCTDACRYQSKRLMHPERERERRLNREHAKRANGSSGTVTRRELRARDGDSCYLCGLIIDFSIKWPNPDSPSMDHVTPISRGGAHHINNTAMTHLSCNLRKGAKVIN